MESIVRPNLMRKNRSGDIWPCFPAIDSFNVIYLRRTYVY